MVLDPFLNNYYCSIIIVVIVFFGLKFNRTPNLKIINLLVPFTFSVQSFYKFRTITETVGLLRLCVKEISLVQDDSDNS